MATMTRKAGRKATGKRPLNMFQGSGENAVTLYNCGTVEQARTDGKPILIVQGGKQRTIKNVRMVHRPDLSGTYGPAHEKAGEGKYIDQSAISRSGKNVVVTGADAVNPYLVENRSYFSIVAALIKMLGKSASTLKATIKRNAADGEHLVWNGSQKCDGAIVVSPWVTKEQLWDQAVKLNDELPASLKRSKSQRSGVKEHLGTKAKFFQNLDVLRRARRIRVVATGETEIGGGETPYAMPLEQCGFAIDQYYLTTGVDADGNEVGEYFYRIAVGRSIPWTLYKRHWATLGTDSPFAYKDEKVLSKAKSAAKKSAA